MESAPKIEAKIKFNSNPKNGHLMDTECLFSNITRIVISLDHLIIYRSGVPMSINFDRMDNFTFNHIGEDNE